MVFSVSYDPNGATGGTVPIDPTQYQIGIQAPVEANTGNLVKNGGTFANWNTAADGTGFGCGGPATVTNVGDVALYARWFTTAGLTRDPQGNEGLTAHYQFSYDSSLQNTGIEPDRTNALIAACGGDFAIMWNWFGGIPP